MSTHTPPASPRGHATKSKTGNDDRLDQAKHVAAEKIQTFGSHYLAEPARDLGSRLREYAHEKPDVAALWCFGLGLVVGWKLRG